MKKFVSTLLAIIMLLTAIVPSYAFADMANVNGGTSFKNAIKTGGNYVITKDFLLSDAKIENSVNIYGDGYTLTHPNSKAPAMLCQNNWAISSFSNINFVGSQKEDVGIWLGSGEMTFTNSTISNFDITTGRFSAIGMVGSTKLTLNNTTMSNNKTYDIVAYDTSTININVGTKLNSVHIASQFVTMNVGENWSGSFDVTFDTPVSKAIGTVGAGADISNINITNAGYYFENVNGKLVVKKNTETAIRFDMSKREELHKGSTGFLYGESEINVPTIDLLQGLKPDTMVQKAVGGLQHPTGDAVRTRSALVSAGVRDMQIYLQDNYLEWPYDAPIKDGKIDIDAYQKSVEKIVRQMICDSNGNIDISIAKKYSFVLFNEPDQIWFGWNLTGLEQAWKQIYTAVKNIYPDARCVGPNYSGFNANDYDNFLKFCKENDCLPEIISWHELGDISLTDFVAHYDAVESFVKKYYPAGQEPELMVNEYARHYDIGCPGGIVKWLSMFEDKDMSGCMAYWAMANSLNEMAADQNSPTSTWWVYHWYAQMTGDQCPLTYPEFDKTHFYGVMSYDEKQNMAYTIFGGSEDENMAEIVYADNLASTNLMNSSGAVNVKIYGVGFSGQQGASYKPEVIFNGAVQTNNGTLKIQLDDVDEMQAYFAVITKPEDNAPISSFDGARISTISYEAENATLLGNATAYSKIGWATFTTSGRADVGSLNNNQSGVQFDVVVPEDGVYNASIFYSLQAPWVNPQTLELQENGQNRGIGKSLPYGVTVDGKELPSLTLESTVTWAYKNHCDIEVPLTAGKHTITYHHINGDESRKGNLQLTAAFDKLDLTKIDTATKNDFEIDLTEMASFKTANGYEVTAVAPVSGYYKITANSDVELTKQAVDYAKDAKTTSECSTYDIPVGSTVYLSQGANTIGVIGSASKLNFVKVNGNDVTISADEITLHGNTPAYKNSDYANSKKVISELGVGQTGNEKYEQNFAYFDVVANDDGYYNLAIRYSNDEPAPVMLKANGDTYVHPYNIDLVERYAQIVVNDSEPETVYFRNTMSWDTFKVVDVQVKLKKGTNRIKIYNDNSYQFSVLVNSTAPEIDEIKVSRLTAGSVVQKVAKTQTGKHNVVKTTKKATCTADGYNKFNCSECDYGYTETIKATGHKTVKIKAIPATYAKAGKTEGSQCSVCKKVVVAQKTVAKKTLAKPASVKATAQKKGFKLTWKKVIASKGYEIQYSTKSNYSSAKKITITKNSTVSKTVSKLTGNKKYYIRIRSYVTENGKKYYSSWVKVSVKTKK